MPQFGSPTGCLNLVRTDLLARRISGRNRRHPAFEILAQRFQIGVVFFEVIKKRDVAFDRICNKSRKRIVVGDQLGITR